MRCFARIGQALDSGEPFSGYRVELAVESLEQARGATSEMNAALGFLQDEQELQEKLTGEKEAMAAEKQMISAVGLGDSSATIK